MHNFKKALKTVFLFSLLVTVMISAICAPYFHSEVYSYQDGYVRDSMAGTLDMLILASSQGVRGISPEILDQQLGCNSYNMASSLMPLKTRYFFLEKEVARNPVDTVIIEVSYDSLTIKWKDRKLEGQLYALGRLPNTLDRLKYTISNVPFSQSFELIYDSMYRGFRSISRLCDGRGLIGESKSYQTKGFVGGNSSPLGAINPDKYFKQKMDTVIYSENLEYLEKIILFCIEHNIDVMLMSTPRANASILASSDWDILNEYYIEVSQQYDIPFYNYNLYKGRTQLFLDESDYIDPGHLSISGSEKMTMLLAEAVQSYQNGIDISNQFYASYQEMIELELLPYVSK